MAAFSDEDIANIDETLKLGGKIEKDDWIGQAQRLLAETTAAEVPAEDDAAKESLSPFVSIDSLKEVRSDWCGPFLLSRG